MDKISHHLTSGGYELDTRPGSFGELRRSSDIVNHPVALRHRFAEDGYLFIPGFFAPTDILAVRQEFIDRLDQTGALDSTYPSDQAVASTQRLSSGKLPARMMFDSPALRKVVFSRSLFSFYEQFFGGPICHFDHIWDRCIPPGKGTFPHADLVYMGRGTHDLMTAWIPYGDVSLPLGGLMILEQSHRQEARLRRYLEGDVDTYCEARGPYKHKTGALSHNPVTLREKLGGRWLTAEFQAGDLLTFGMKTVHASLDNQTTCYRFSSDTRYQLATEAIDPRWVGPDTQEYAEKNRIGTIC